MRAFAEKAAVQLLVVQRPAALLLTHHVATLPVAPLRVVTQDVRPAAIRMRHLLARHAVRTPVAAVERTRRLPPTHNRMIRVAAVLRHVAQVVTRVAVLLRAVDQNGNAVIARPAVLGALSVAANSFSN